ETAAPRAARGPAPARLQLRRRRRRREQRGRVPVRAGHAEREGHPAGGPGHRTGVRRDAARRWRLRLRRPRRRRRRPQLLGVVVRPVPGGDAGVPGGLRRRPRRRGAVPRPERQGARRAVRPQLRRPVRHPVPVAARPPGRGGAGVPGLPGQRDPVHHRAGPRVARGRGLHRRGLAGEPAPRARPGAGGGL
ncbi:MAG: Thiol:disulfide oxidoreductase related to ResA, partial [uncultured Blastococcus sp.]